MSKRTFSLAIISVGAGGGLGTIAAMEIVPFFWFGGTVLGAIAGLLSAPIVVLCLIDKSLMFAVPLAYGPTLIVEACAILTGSPIWTMLATICTLWIACLLVREYLPNALSPDDSPHCEQCDYNLTGNESGICPECGTRISASPKEGETILKGSQGAESSTNFGKYALVASVIIPIAFSSISLHQWHWRRSPKSIDELITMLSYNDMQIQWEAKHELIQHGKVPLLKALNDSNPKIRANAAHALGLLGDESVITPLVSSLDDENEYVRRWAVWSLGKLGNPMTIREISGLRNDPSPIVRSAAIESLKKIRE